MHTCRKIEKLLDAYTDGELDEPRRFWLEAHLQECARCSRLALDKKDEARLIRSGYPVPALSTGFTGRVMSNLARSSGAVSFQAGPGQDTAGARARSESFFSLRRLGGRLWLAPALTGLALLVTVSWAASRHVLPTPVAAGQNASMAGQSGPVLRQTPAPSGHDNLAPQANPTAFGVSEKSAKEENIQSPADGRGVAGQEAARPEGSRAIAFSPQENSVVPSENPNPMSMTAAGPEAPATAIPAPPPKSYEKLEQQGYPVFWPGYLPPGYSLSSISAQPPQPGASATQDAAIQSGSGSLQFSYRNAQTDGWITLEVQPLNAPNTPVPQPEPAANDESGNQQPSPLTPAEAAESQPAGTSRATRYARKYGANFLLTVTGSLAYEELEQVAVSVQ